MTAAPIKGGTNISTQHFGLEKTENTMEVQDLIILKNVYHVIYEFSLN